MNPRIIKKKPLKVESLASDPNVIIIDGEKYSLDKITSKTIDKVPHTDKFIYKPMNETQFDKDLKLVVETIAKKTDAEEIIKEVLKHTPANYLRRLAKRIRDKKSVTKQHGCLGFKIGDAYVQVVD
jgi:hypothetical protein